MFQLFGLVFAVSILVSAALYGIDAIAPLPWWAWRALFVVDAFVIVAFVVRMLLLFAVATFRGH